MLMTKTCNSKGCNNPIEKKEIYKVLDNDFNMYSFKVSLCNKCYEQIHEIKEKLTGDFSVFFSIPIKKKYY
jgi:hypothetical protein